jgi:outer membrane protein assembly factor BamB
MMGIAVVMSSPVFGANVIYFGSTDGNVYAVD